MKRFSTNKMLTAGIGVVMFTIALIFFVSVRQSQRVKSTTGLISHTEEVLKYIQKIIQHALDNETDARGFVITGNNVFLESLRNAEHNFYTEENSLTQLVADDPLELKWLDSLKIYIDKRIAFSDSMIMIREQDGLQASIAIVEKGTGKLYTDRIRSIGHEMENLGNKLLDKRKERNDIAISQLNVILYIGLAVVFLLSVFITRRVKTDITRQKASEQKFKSLLDAAPDATVIVNNAGVIKMINKQTEKLFGYTREELTEQSVEMLVPDDLKTKHKIHRINFLKEANSRLMGAGLELNAVKKDSSLFPVEISLSPIDTEEGMLVSASVRDITERKKEEEKIEASRKMFSTIFYKSPVINAITDASTGAFIEVNENFIDFTEFTKEEIIGKSSLELNLIPDPRQRTEIINIIKEKGFTIDALIEIRTKNGKYKWVSTSAHTVNINGKDCFLTGMVDITERKKAEEQLESVNKELEAFSYSVSHDLRSPLRIIDGYADILINDYRDKLDEEGKRTLNIVKTNAQRMGQLIDDLLNLSKIGRKELLMHFTDMNKLVNTIIDEQFCYNDNVKAITVKKLESVECDSSLVRQVWVNLISNALKYSGKQKDPKIEISSIRRKDDVLYAIKDNGVGFDMKYAEKLFGVFQRLHKITEYEGTGIGLALVKRILTRHEGKIWAESEPGKGTTFFFTLPA